MKRIEEERKRLKRIGGYFVVTTRR